MTQILMPDVDVPGPVIAAGRLANKVTFGGRRVRQLAAVNPFGIGAAGGRSHRHQQGRAQGKGHR